MAEVIVPKGTVPGTLEWMQTNASLAKSWANRANGDVRELVKYLRRIKQHNWRSLVGGVDDWPRLCREVLDSHPTFLAQMEAGVAALEDKGHEGPISVEQAQAAATTRDRVQEAAKKTTGEVLPAHRPTTIIPESTEEPTLSKIADDRVSSKISDLSQSTRAKENSVSVYTQRKLDRLAQVRPDLLTQVQEGELSVHAAAIEAGIVKVPTLVQQAAKLLKKLTTEELVEALLTLPVDVRQRLAEALTGAQTQP